MRRFSGSEKIAIVAMIRMTGRLATARLLTVHWRTLARGLDVGLCRTPMANLRLELEHLLLVRPNAFAWTPGEAREYSRLRAEESAARARLEAEEARAIAEREAALAAERVTTSAPASVVPFAPEDTGAPDSGRLPMLEGERVQGERAEYAPGRPAGLALPPDVPTAPADEEPADRVA